MEPEELTKMLEAHRIWLESNGKEGKRAVGKHNFSRNDLTGTELSKARLKKSDFSKANLEGANLKGAELGGAIFKDANLQNTILQGANLLEVDFSGATLTNANLQGAILRRARFENSKLGGRARLREADLRNADLENALYLQTAQLAGADVAGAKLPKPIAEFEGLKTIAEATSNAQKLFVAMLSGCLYCWLTIGTTKDAALLTNSASSPLPIIGTAIPIVGFYLVAPTLLTALYFYFHLNMQRIWEALADLPALFPDGRTLDKRADPWLLNGLVCAHFVRLRRERPSLSRVQQWLSILLTWCVVPVTLFMFWGRFLMRHDWFGTSLHIGLLAVAVGFGSMSYRLARMTLRGVPREPFRWACACKNIRTYKRVAGILGICVVGVILYYISLGAIEGVPNTVKAPNLPTYNLRRLVPRSLETIGCNPFANLGEQEVSTKPANWTGKAEEYPLVKGARLVDVRMQYANARSAFLVNADLRNANLSNADLSHANVSYANLSNADLSYANFSHADLPHVNLSHAKLDYANLRSANLTRADLSDANLSHADLSNANLSNANLSAHLSYAKLFYAHLSNANLSSADLSHANLSYADLSHAYLSNANLSNATVMSANVSDADPSNANLSNTNFLNANLSNANLSGSNLKDVEFAGANLHGTNLKRVDLRQVKDLTKSQLENALVDEETVLPENLRR